MAHEEAFANASSAPASGAAAEEVGKVAAVTVSFWILKTVITTVGDLSGDLLSITLRLGYALALVVALAVTASLLIGQLRAKRFHPLLFWALILSSSTVGAEVSDGIDRALHLGNAAGSGVLLVCLLVALAAWVAGRGAIRFHPVRARQDELFYWLAAILANSLGSALGDLFGDKLGLGVLDATGVNLLILAVLLALHHTTRASKALLFWGAFVFTRIPF